MNERGDRRRENRTVVSVVRQELDNNLLCSLVNPSHGALLVGIAERQVLAKAKEAHVVGYGKTCTHIQGKDVCEGR